MCHRYDFTGFNTLIGAYGLELTWPQWSLIAGAGLLLLVAGRTLAAKLRPHCDRN